MSSAIAFIWVLIRSAPGNDLVDSQIVRGAFQRTLGKVIRDHFPDISGVNRIVLAAELCLCTFVRLLVRRLPLRGLPFFCALGLAESLWHFVRFGCLDWFV